MHKYNLIRTSLTVQHAPAFNIKNAPRLVSDRSFTPVNRHDRRHGNVIENSPFYRYRDFYQGGAH